MTDKTWRGRIRRWHYGKLVILWSWGGALTALAYFLVVGLEPEDGAKLALGFAAIVLLGAIPLALSAVTWIWLGGREKGAQEAAGRANGDEPAGLDSH